MKQYPLLFLLALFWALFAPFTATAHDVGSQVGSTTVLSDLKTAVDELPDTQSLAELTAALNNILEKAKAVIQAYPGQTEAVQANARDRLTESMDLVLTYVDDLLGELLDSDTRPSEVSGIVAATGGIVSAMAALDIFPTRDMVDTGSAISRKVYQAILDDILSPRNVTASEIQEYLDSPDAARSFFLDDPGALGAAADPTLVPFGSRFTPPSSYTGVFPQVVDVNDPVWADFNDDSNGVPQTYAALEATTGLDLFKNVWPDLMDSSRVTVDEASGNIRVRHGDGTGAAAAVRDLGPVSEFLPAGISFLPDGRRLGVDAGVGFVMVPATPDPEAVVALIKDLGGTIVFEDNGLWRLNFVQGVDIVCGWAWDLQAENGFSAGTVSFTVTGTDFAAESFAVLLSYADGTVQQAAPLLRALDPFLAMLDGRFPGLYALNRTTGVLDLTLLGLGNFKADWRFESLEQGYDALVAQVLALPGGFTLDQLVFEARDFNQDGKVDLQFYSPDPRGRQILYAL